MQNNELMFPSNSRSASHKNLDRYSYHVYGGIGYFYSVVYNQLASQVPSGLRKCRGKPVVMHSAVPHPLRTRCWTRAAGGSVTRAEFGQMRCDAQVRHDYKMPVDISEYGITTDSVPGTVRADLTASLLVSAAWGVYPVAASAQLCNAYMAALDRLNFRVDACFIFDDRTAAVIELFQVQAESLMLPACLSDCVFMRRVCSLSRVVTAFEPTRPVSVPQTGCLADKAPLMSRLSSTTAYLLGANVPRLNIFKASNTPSGVRCQRVKRPDLCPPRQKLAVKCADSGAGRALMLYLLQS